MKLLLFDTDHGGNNEGKLGSLLDDGGLEGEQNANELGNRWKDWWP